MISSSTTTLCTWHDSIAVVACAKFSCDSLVEFWVIISNLGCHKPLPKHSPDEIVTLAPCHPNWIIYSNVAILIAVLLGLFGAYLGYSYIVSLSQVNEIHSHVNNWAWFGIKIPSYQCKNLYCSGNAIMLSFHRSGNHFIGKRDGPNITYLLTYW